MKYYFPFFVAVIAAVPALGQNSSEVPAKQEGTPAGNWSKLGPTIEGTKGFTLYGRDIRLDSEGQYQLHVKITPASPPAFAKRFSLPASTNYVVQFATVDCTARVLLLEKTAAYNAAGKVLKSPDETLTPSSRKDSVKPGSVGEALYRFVCVETTSLPLTENRN